MEKTSSSCVPARGKPPWAARTEQATLTLQSLPGQSETQLSPALTEKPGEEMGSGGNQGGCHLWSTAFEHNHALRDPGKMLHSHQNKSAPSSLCSYSWAQPNQKVVLKRIKDDCLSQQIPFSCWQLRQVWLHAGRLLGSVGHFRQGSAQLWSHRFFITPAIEP